jgi:hypothetical protein
LCAFIAYAIHAILSPKTLFTLHEANGVVITLRAEPYRSLGDQSIYWTVKRGRKTVLHGHSLDAYRNPLFPSLDYKVLRSKDGTVLGIVSRRSPDRALALYDVTTGAHWDVTASGERKRDVGKTLLEKLRTGVNGNLNLL